MIDLQNEMAELTRMHGEMNQSTIDALGGVRGSYVERLAESAKRSFMRSDLLMGTTIQNPSFLAKGKRGVPVKSFSDKTFAMYVRNIELDHGYFVSFPLRTAGITVQGVPIIEPPLDKENYTVAYLPNDETTHYETSNPADMRAEFVFNVDCDDFVTINGIKPVTPAEYALFDTVVCVFEQRSMGTISNSSVS